MKDEVIGDADDATDTGSEETTGWDIDDAEDAENSASETALETEENECALNTSDVAPPNSFDDDADDGGFFDDDDAHDTIVQVQSAPHVRPHAGCEEETALPGSHSSPTILLTIPSPHRTFVHTVVQFGPTPLRVASSHSSGALMTPFPQNESTWPRN